MRSAFCASAVLALLVCGSPARGVDTIRVVATLPDLADWARELGGDRVKVRSLLKGFENPHTYEPKVSDVKALAGSRVLVKVGLGLETWIDGLVENARNSELIIVEASKGVPVIDDDEEHAGEGHAHPAGNPHVWLDPGAVPVMCANITRTLEMADPFAGDYYQKHLAAYVARVAALAARLRDEAARLPDRRFISYHAAWPYFARGLGFEVVGVIEPMPGREPSARGLSSLIERIRSEKIRVLVTEPQLSSKLPGMLAQDTGIRVVTLSPLLGSGPAQSYLELFESNARALIAALRGPPP